MPPRTYVPAERLKALDQGGVDAELLYPTPRIAGGMLASAGDPEFHLACIRAYNNWLSEFCSYAPDRLMGHALMPAVGAGAAVDELHRAMQLPGMRSPCIGRWPSGGASLSTQDDLFWAAVQELDVPVSVHVSVATGDQRGDSDANRTRLGARGEFRGLGGPTAVNCLELISTGVFDRFPDMRIVFAECESGWVPCARQTFDDRFRRYPPGVRGRPEVKELPGFYFDRNIFTTFVIDPYAIRNRDLVGVEQMMWSNDLFHAVNEWPNDWAAIERDFAGVAAHDKELILAGNAVRVYRLDGLTPGVRRS